MPLITFPNVGVSNLVITPDEHVVASRSLTGKLYVNRVAPGGRFRVEVAFTPFWDDDVSKANKSAVQNFIAQMSRLLDADDPPRTRLTLTAFSDYIPLAPFASGGAATTISAKVSEGKYRVSRSDHGWSVGDFVSIGLTPYRRLFQIAGKTGNDTFDFSPAFELANGTTILPVTYAELMRENFSLSRNERVDNDPRTPSVITMSLTELHVATS